MGNSQSYVAWNGADLDVDSGKNINAVLYIDCLHSRWSDHRCISQNIRGLSGRIRNSNGKSEKRKAVRLQPYACHDHCCVAAASDWKQRRSGGRTYGDYRRIMLLGRRESEVCKAAYKRIFTNRNCCFSQRIISCAAVRNLRSRGGFGRVPAK